MFRLRPTPQGGCNMNKTRLRDRVHGEPRRRKASHPAGRRRLVVPPAGKPLEVKSSDGPLEVWRSPRRPGSPPPAADRDGKQDAAKFPGCAASRLTSWVTLWPLIEPLCAARDEAA